MSDQVDAMAYALTALSPGPPHRPRHTSHGTHCTCGVFCGSSRESWAAHKADRALLDQCAVFIDTPPTGLEAMRYAWEAFRDALSRINRTKRDDFVLVPPSVVPKLDIPSQSEGH